MKRIFLLSVFAGLLMMTYAQNYKQNLFTGNTDIGSCGIAGSLSYDSENQSYTIAGSGENI
ncbi:MAG TPA: hypothetical protein PLP88_02405, partial [Bacteroidales bacterium]|nr:hypothetical protein [Bacteroidales bacterium]